MSTRIYDVLNAICALSMVFHILRCYSITNIFMLSQYNCINNITSCCSAIFCQLCQWLLFYNPVSIMFYIVIIYNTRLVILYIIILYNHINNAVSCHVAVVPTVSTALVLSNTEFPLLSYLLLLHFISSCGSININMAH